MAELVYNEEGRLLFTEEMRKEYTILIPQMLPIHFNFLVRAMREAGYNIELLTTTGQSIVTQGLQSVHNDTCYPALLVIGQMMDAIESGKYDTNKVALMITQTGGGCRASNYIHLLRKALKKRGLEHIPVISFNLAGMEKNPGFKFTPQLILKMLGAVVYGDLLMLLSNQTRPYEIVNGETDRLIEKWTDELLNRNLSIRHISRTLEEITQSFAEIKLNKVPKVRVGVVGEIYIKYAPLGNNNLEQFLATQDCEVTVPGLLDFIIFMGDHHLVDTKKYKIKYGKALASGALKVLMTKFQKKLIKAVNKYPQFRAPADFETIKSLTKGYLSDGNKMGEGWLLTGEMLELIHSGTENIICTQPFGCLPNHIVGKGMIRAIRKNHPNSNIVAIDYDPGATKANQENRIKLMLSIARENLLKDAESKSTHKQKDTANV
ncbi:MAG: 2-hydroxyacyl-CoA dehydratase [Clostridia bacterium]|nr:2-hydroxyacyl-CoA dehydratase [Clostridia bacterium]